MTQNVRIPLLVFIVSIIALEFPGAGDLVRTPYSGIETLNLVVQNIDAISPNVGGEVRRNDEIREIEGVRVRNRNHLRAMVGANSGMAPQTYTVQRGDTRLQATVQYIPMPRSILYRRFPHLLVAFTFLLVGVLVLIRRSDAVGTLFSLNCALLAFFLTDRPIASVPFLQLLAELIDDAAILLFPAVFLHFFLVFHDRPRGMSRRERIRRYVWVYSLPAAVYVVGSLLAILRFLGDGAHGSLVQALLVASTTYYTVYLVASLVIFVRNYRSSSVGQQQKLTIAILGTVVGILPFLSMIVWRQISTDPHDLLEFLSVLGLGFVSVSFAYAILKHGAIEVNIVVRKSLVYGLFSGVIIAGYYTIVNLVGDYVTRELKLQPMYLSFATVLLLAVIFAPARDLVQRVTDRLFFRGDYDYKHEVVEFNRRLSTTLRKDEIFDLFFAKIEALLHASYVAFYARSRDDNEWVMVRSAGQARASGGSAGDVSASTSGTTLPAFFPRASMLVRYLVRYRRPLMVEFLDYSWGKRNLDESSATFLRESGAAVCVPVCGPDSLMGLAVLGPKRSGQLYNQTDSKLIERFASHMALVLDNAELHEATVEQERLRNELLLARDIQLGLLPTEPPRHPSIEVLGKMVSSAEVGGDYFDYFMLDDQRIGVAVGDVSGKGVPAAMLMSSVQAVFKKLALRDKLNPADVVAELNEHLCSSAKTDQFATFFYGIIDTRGSTVTFSNAGHCPPLLCKRAYVDRLGEGGLPLGVDNQHRHEQGTVRVDPGDLLCLYTDGIVEQSDGNGDQFGERRLVHFLEANRNLPICELPELLFAAVQDFGAGRQDDDTTCLIACYNAR